MYKQMRWVGVGGGGPGKGGRGDIMANKRYTIFNGKINRHFVTAEVQVQSSSLAK